MSSDIMGLRVSHFQPTSTLPPEQLRQSDTARSYDFALFRGPSWTTEDGRVWSTCSHSLVGCGCDTERQDARESLAESSAIVQRWRAADPSRVFYRALPVY